MSTLQFMISEAFLHKEMDKDPESRKSTIEFAKEAGLDLSIRYKWRKLSLYSLKRRLKKLGLDYELIKNGERFEFLIKFPQDKGVWLIIDSDDEESDLDMITIGRGSDLNLTINLFKKLIIYHGRFIYYCASGIMSLITEGKSNEQIIKEMSG